MCTSDIQFLTAQELADRWRLRPESVMQFARNGRIPGALRLLDTQWRFRVTEIVDYENNSIAAIAAMQEEQPRA